MIRLTEGRRTTRSYRERSCGDYQTTGTVDQPLVVLNELPDLEALRSVLETAFSTGTAQPGTRAAQHSSAGHCAAVSVIVHDRFGGELLSTSVAGRSHWFNRLRIGTELVDVDLTGDQFGFAAVRAVPAGELHTDVRHRSIDQLQVETLIRAAALAGRAQLRDTASRLERICEEREEVTAHRT